MGRKKTNYYYLGGTKKDADRLVNISALLFTLPFALLSFDDKEKTEEEEEKDAIGCAFVFFEILLLGLIGFNIFFGVINIILIILFIYLKNKDK